MEIDSDVQHRCRGINALLAQNSVRDGYNKQEYGMMRCMYRRDLKKIVHSTLISNFPVITDDVTMSNRIYGVNLYSLKGKKL